MTQSDVGRALEDAARGVAVSSTELDRLSYARDLWPRHHIAVRDRHLPDTKPAAIVWPTTTEEVAAIVRRCAEEGIPIAPFGAGSGVCAGTLPDSRTVVIDLKKLSRVRRLEREGAQTLDVEAGAMGIRLQEDLEARGYTLGHFPSSILCSTVGGWVAARSAGQCSGYYGKIEDMVVSLECVVGRGEVVRLRRRVNGPDVTPLIVGSEGVLGIVTSSELRIHQAPESRTFAAYTFPSTEAGWLAMRDMFQAGLRPAVARLYDAFDSFMARRGAVKSHGPKKKAQSGPSKLLKTVGMRWVLRMPSVMNGVVDRLGDRAFGGAMLVLVYEGKVGHAKDDLGKTRNIAQRHGGKDLGEGPARHWFKNRYAVSYRQAPVFMAGAFSDTMEVAAPWSKLRALYDGVRAAMHDNVFVMAHLSHAYPDGCSIYFTFAGSAPTRAAAEELYDRTWNDALDAAIAAGGTLSHHHGVGRSKAPKLGKELGLGVEVVHALRATLDPAGIFNPGNLLPREPVPRPAAEVTKPTVRAPLFDDASLLVWANGETTLGAIEDGAAARGMSLETANLNRFETVAAYLARGAPGSIDPYEDPADHFVAGFTAKLGSGQELAVAPGPRRAVGPDLYALFHGTAERAGVITSAHLRLHRRGSRARALATSIDRTPPLDPAEQALVDAVLASASQARYRA